MGELTEVINWRRVSAGVTTSGQPTEAQLAQIKALGVADLINLGPHSNKGALPDEAGSVAALGMRYVYIPVDFEAPTEDDFAAFCAAMADVGDRPVHVHCIYNARVSAFFYRYALAGFEDAGVAFSRMDSIWRPGGVWAAFIGKPEEAGLPNRYAGDEYEPMTNARQDRNGFFIGEEECITCGCCHNEAADNFTWSYDADGSFGGAVVRNQPRNEAELAGIIEAQLSVCMVDCIYYGRTDKTIIARLIEKGAPPGVIVTLNKSPISKFLNFLRR